MFAQSDSNDGSSLTRKRYLPECTESGDLMLPKNFNEWVYVCSPLTPNALNGSKANFPEFHNVYIEPGSYEIYKKTGEFPEGTIFFKELQLTLPSTTGMLFHLRFWKLPMAPGMRCRTGFPSLQHFRQRDK